ncbi:MAG: leucine-rich repeat protein [Clostridia bacterium]|nr:leucine-rich repeat protein [Clostridia bacterium]
MKRRFVAYFLGVFICSILLQTFQLTAVAVNSEFFGNGLSWAFNSETNKLTVSTTSGPAVMPDFDDPISDPYSSNIPPWTAVKTEVETVIIENGVINIGNNAFSNFNSLIKVDLPQSLSYIGDYSFSNCVSLGNILFPDSLVSIGVNAFDNCASLKTLEFPENIAAITPYSFLGCGGLAHLKVDKNNPYYESVGNCLIDSKKKSVILGCAASVIPTDGSVTSISPSAFYKCTGLKSINIPSLRDYEFTVGDSAFYGCSSLESVSFYGSIAEWEVFVSRNVDIHNDPLINAKCRCISFADVITNAWYAASVQYVSALNLIVGYGNGSFGTSDHLRRQDAVVILSRLSKNDISGFSSSSPFPDIKQNMYYTAAVTWGKMKGIVNGYTNGKFGLGDKVTREQFICFLYRYAKYTGADTALHTDKSVYAQKYTDFYNISPYAVDAVCWALERGVISGRTENTIAPQGYAMRCEISQIFYNIFKNGIM